MKDVNSIYDNNIHIITSNENKKMFKKMLLDNPYLYFTNFDIKQSFTKKQHRELEDLKTRTIYIIDINVLQDDFDIESLLNKNIHLILISNVDNYDDKIISTYNSIGDNKLLIHTINKLKMMQKQFYKKIVKTICSNQPDDFESYYNLINNENLDLKYIVFKNNELRYN